MNDGPVRERPMAGSGIQGEAVGVGADVVEVCKAGRRAPLWTNAWSLSPGAGQT